MRHEGSRAWKALNDAYTTGKVPTGQLADAALILVGGVLLMLPGFVTDVFGFLFLLPWTRPFARKMIAFFVARRISKRAVPAAGSTRRTSSRGRPSRARPEPTAEAGRGIAETRPSSVQGEIEGRLRRDLPLGEQPARRRGRPGSVRLSTSPAGPPRATPKSRSPREDLGGLLGSGACARRPWSPARRSAADSAARRAGPRARRWSDARAACPSGYAPASPPSAPAAHRRTASDSAPHRGHSHSEGISASAENTKLK